MVERAGASLLRAPARSDTGAMLLHYDTHQRRLWLLGQRCHHGATGALLLALGTALMAHDWKDRSMWFQRGWGNQA